jgi:hypothetical protein
VIHISGRVAIFKLILIVVSTIHQEQNTVVPWFVSIIHSGNVLLIQSTRISKRISP